MAPSWNESVLRTIGRWGLGLATVFVLMALSLTPFEIANLGAIRPAFILMAIYYWTILRPGLVPPLAVFALGLVLDLLGGFPFGFNALIFVATQWVARGQRKFFLGQSFMATWLGFLVVALGASLLQWALFAVFNLTVFTIKPALVGALVSVLLFPLIVLPLSVVYKALTDAPPEG